MKKTISIRFTPKQLDLPALGGGDTDLLKAKLQQRWPELMKEILAEKADVGKDRVQLAGAADQDDQNDDGPFVDIDQGPDFIDVHPADDTGGDQQDGVDDGGDGRDGDGGDGRDGE